MRSTQLLLAALTCVASAASVSCTAAPQVILKDPIADRCAAAELTGCASVTDGVLLYVSGDKANGRDKLLGSAAQTRPITCGISPTACSRSSRCQAPRRT